MKQAAGYAILVCLVSTILFSCIPLTFAAPNYVVASYEFSELTGGGWIGGVYPGTGALIKAYSETFQPTANVYLREIKVCAEIGAGAPNATFKIGVAGCGNNFNQPPNATVYAVSTNSFSTASLNNLTYTNVTLTFDGTYLLLSTQKYALYVYGDSQVVLDGVNTVRIGYDGTGVGAGSDYYFSNSGWTENPNTDLVFEVWGNDELPDSVVPTLGSVTSNSTVAGQPYRLSCIVSDNIAVDKVIFSTNKTGVWTNETALSGSGTSYIANFTDTWSTTIGTTIQAKVYANDTSNNWNSSATYSFTSTTPFTLGAITATNQLAGQAVTLSCTATNQTTMSHYIYSWNNTGTWVNQTTTAFSTATATLSGTWNTTWNTKVSVIVYANETSNIWQTSSTYTFTLTNPATTPSTLNVTPLWQYLYAGNLWGLLNAIYLIAFGIEDLVVGVILLIIFGPLYVKTKSLLLCSICWILLGGIFITLVPMLSGLAVILLILGVASLLYKLIRPD